MKLLDTEHYELIAMFEKEYSHRRLAKEPKDYWPSGNVFQDGQTNELFQAYRRGYSFGRATA